MPDDEFLAQLKAFEGREVAGLVAHDEVNQAMIRHWVHAMGDGNPVYVDPDAAAASVHGEIIAPPVMLQAWTSHGLARGSASRSADGESVGRQLFRILKFKPGTGRNVVAASGSG